MTRFLKSALFRLLISLAAIGLVLYSLRDKLGEAFQILSRDVRWDLFLAALVSYSAVQIIMAYRLHVLFHVKKISIRFTETFHLCLVGLFFNLFLPSAVGGDVAKIYYAYKHSGKKIESATAVLLDRLLGFIAIMTIAGTGLALTRNQFDDPRVSIIVYLFIAVVAGVSLFFVSRRVARIFRHLRVLIPSQKILDKVTEFYHAIHDSRNSARSLAACILISITGQTFVILMYYFLSLSLGTNINFWIFFVLIPVVSIVSMVPSLGGLGVREAGAIYLFSFYMPQERALALSLLVFVIVYGTGFLCGALYALSGGLKGRAMQELGTVTKGAVE